MIEIITVNAFIFFACKVFEAMGASQFFVKKLEDVDQIASLIIVLIFVADTIFTIGLSALRREPNE
jgi:hypothetical protein